MKVKELRERLLKFDGEMDVVLGWQDEDSLYYSNGNIRGVRLGLHPNHAREDSCENKRVVILD